MSVLDRFEKSVEGAVNGVFAKFGSKDLKPVDLSSALEREIDKEAMPVTRDRTVAPNEYRFKLSTPDFNNIVEWGAETLANELADNLTQYAKSQNYAFVGPVVVIFEEDLELSKGDYRLSSESVQGNTVPVTTDAQTEDCPMLEIGEHQYLLTEEKTIIGRGSDCDIVIDDPGISRRHMEIDVTDNGNTVIARDLNSTNGMYVEGHHVEAATLLDGNTITIGRTRILYWASRRSKSNQPQPGEPPFMLTELTFAILKYGFLVLLWIFVACTVRSLYRDIETLSPRKSRAHRRKERAARKAVESPAPVAAAALRQAPQPMPNQLCWSLSMAPLPAVPPLWPATPSHLAVPLRTPWCWMMNSFPPTMRASTPIPPPAVGPSRIWDPPTAPSSIISVWSRR